MLWELLLILYTHFCSCRTFLIHQGGGGICLEFIYSKHMISKLCVHVLCFYSADIMHTPHVKNASVSISLFLGKPQEILFKLPWKDRRLNRPNLDVTLMFFLDFSLNS